MPVEKVVDSLGYSMTLYRHKRKPHIFSNPRFNHESLEGMPEVTLRDSDVMLLSYPKCGCHWLWEWTRMLLTGNARLDDVNKESAMMENQGREEIDAMTSPRILNNHQYFCNQPDDLLKKKVKVIFFYRNPKDVAVSFYYHQKRLPDYHYDAPDFGSYLPRFVDGLIENNCYFDYLRDWERVIQKHTELSVCMLCYEDLQADPLPEIQKLSSFLGQKYSDEFLRDVITTTSIDKMREAKVNSKFDRDGSIMYRKGKVGDWKNHFTVAQSEWFDHVTRIRMAGSQMFRFRYDI